MGGGHLSLAHTTTADEEGGTSCPTLLPSGSTLNSTVCPSEPQGPGNCSYSNYHIQHVADSFVKHFTSVIVSFLFICLSNWIICHKILHILLLSLSYAWGIFLSSSVLYSPCELTGISGGLVKLKFIIGRIFHRSCGLCTFFCYISGKKLVLVILRWINGLK